LLQAGGVFSKNRLLAAAILKAGEVLLEERGALIGQVVNHPLRAALAVDHPPTTHVSEVAGDFNLRFAQDLLKVANAERTLQKKVRDAKACSVAKALVDSDQLHARPYTRKNEYAGSKINEAKPVGVRFWKSARRGASSSLRLF
jgi:hypothetical protein